MNLNVGEVSTVSGQVFKFLLKNFFVDTAIMELILYSKRSGDELPYNCIIKLLIVII